MKKEKLLLYNNVNCFKIAIILSKVKVFYCLKNVTNHLFLKYF